MSVRYRFIDIAANLTDAMFRGVYNGSNKHEPDLPNVLQRAKDAGIDKIIITGTDLETSKSALEYAQTDSMLYSTVGCHPTSCKEFDKSGDANMYLNSLLEMASNNKGKVVAFGECGLDYDRLEFCDRNTQIKYFEKQLEINEQLKLPLFLHCRNAAEDFISMIKNCNNWPRGVVHSFTDSKETLYKLLDMGFYIGVNGCSLKTADNLEVVKQIPLNQLMIETDCPWCEIRPTHVGFKYVKTSYTKQKKEKWEASSMVKSRNEPCSIVQVFEILCAIRSEQPEELSQQIYQNTEKLFFK